MAYLGDAIRDAIREFRDEIPVDTSVPKATFERQTAYLEKRLGRDGAAAAAGVSPRTWSLWRAGRRRPTGASQAKVKGAYETQRRPEIRRRRQTADAPARLRHVRMQISGTAQVSRKKSYRPNFAEGDLTSVDLSSLWPARASAAKLAPLIEAIIQAETNVSVTWPENDVTISLLG